MVSQDVRAHTEDGTAFRTVLLSCGEGSVTDRMGVVNG